MVRGFDPHRAVRSPDTDELLALRQIIRLPCRVSDQYYRYIVYYHCHQWIKHDPQASSGQETDYIANTSYFILVSRSNLQLAAYTLVGISSIILGLLIASSGLLPRFIGWVAIFGGLIYASFGWIGIDHILFMVGRLLFLLALIILGSFLLLRGTRKKTEK